MLPFSRAFGRGWSCPREPARTSAKSAICYAQPDIGLDDGNGYPPSDCSELGGAGCDRAGAGDVVHLGLSLVLLGHARLRHKPTPDVPYGVAISLGAMALLLRPLL